jgi:hypothetical protein
MKTQQAIDVGYEKKQGTLKLEELSRFLAEGWVVVQTATSGGGDILVILEKEVTGQERGE